MPKVSAIPEGFTTITPSLVLKDAAKAIALYEKALGAKTLYSMKMPGSDKIMHACLQIGDSKLFLCDASPEKGCANPSVSSFYLYMPDIDAAVRKAKEGGMQEKMPVEDMFWGDRIGSLTDSFGINWTLATHVRDVSDAEMQEGMKKFSKAA